MDSFGFLVPLPPAKRLAAAAPLSMSSRLTRPRRKRATGLKVDPPPGVEPEGPWPRQLAPKTEKEELEAAEMREQRRQRQKKNRQELWKEELTPACRAGLCRSRWATSTTRASRP